MEAIPFPIAEHCTLFTAARDVWHVCIQIAFRVLLLKSGKF